MFKRKRKEYFIDLTTGEYIYSRRKAARLMRKFIPVNAYVNDELVATWWGNKSLDDFFTVGAIDFGLPKFCDNIEPEGILN